MRVVKLGDRSFHGTADRGVVAPLDEAEHMDIPKTSPTIAQVGFKKEGDLAVFRVTICSHLEQFGQVLLGLDPPLGKGRFPKRSCRSSVAGHEAQVEPGNGRKHLKICEVESRCLGVHRWRELQAGVPEGVPERFTQRSDRGVPGFFGMNQQQVDVASRAQLMAAGPTDRHQRPSRFPNDSGGDRRNKPEGQIRKFAYQLSGRVVVMSTVNEISAPGNEKVKGQRSLTSTVVRWRRDLAPRFGYAQPRQRRSPRSFRRQSCRFEPN